MSRVFGLIFTALLLPTAARAALPPVPDSLRAVVRAAPLDGSARAAALLRVARAYRLPFDSAGVLGYARAASRAAPTDALIEGRALDLMGDFLREAGELPRAARLLRRAAQCLAAAPSLDRAALAYHRGMLYADQGRFSAARAAYHTALALYERLGNRTQLAEVWNSLGLFYHYQDQADSATLYLFRAVRAHPPDALAAAAPLGNLALVYHGLGQWAAAGQFARRAFRLEVAAHDTVAYSRTLTYLGVIAGKYPDSLAAALAYLRRAARLLRQTQQPNEVARVLVQQGGLWEKRAHPDSAAACYDRARRLSHSLADIAPELQALGNLAALYLAQNRYPAAHAAATAAIKLDTSQMRPALSERPWAVLRQVAERTGQVAEAYRLLQRETTLRQRRYTAENQRLTQELRVTYETEQAEQRAEQQAALLAQQTEVARLRQQRTLLLGGTLLLTLLAAGTVAGVALRRRQRRLETALRHQLAADLHDDVGALLTHISLESALLADSRQPPAQQLARVQRLTTASQQAARQLRDVVWSVDAQNDTFARLLARLRDYAHELLPAAGIEVDFRADLPPGLPTEPLRPAARQALYPIFKESLHNLIKHARGAEVATIHLRVHNATLELTITDDGTAPPPPPDLATTPPARGHGLTNLQQRARQVGGSVTWTAARPRGGWLTTVRLPLRSP